MTYHGVVRNGVIVLEDAPPLAEGASVCVVLDEPAPLPGQPGSVEAFLAADATWEGDPAELDRLLEDVQRMREEDLQRELANPAAEDQLP